VGLHHPSVLDMGIVQRTRPLDGLQRRVSPTDARSWSMAPPFFGGRLMLAIVAATGQWGPLRLSQIERTLGRSNRSWRTNHSALLLEQQGVVVRTLSGRRNTTVELNRRHPHFEDLSRFARSLYELYVRGLELADDGLCAPTASKYVEAQTCFDSHALGSDCSVRALHLLFETGPIPGFLVNRLLGVSCALDLRLHSWVSADVVKVDRKGRQLYYSLNADWSAYYNLQRLLASLNVNLPEYEALAQIYHERRLSGKYEWSRYEFAEIRRRRTARSAVPSALITQI
jgi:hypothetical protein